jgi:DNA polymerase-3 subunit delta
MQRATEVHQLELEVDAARALGAAIGTDLGVLAQELEKLTAFVGGRGRITVQDVDAAGTKLPSQDRWQWFDLVGERDFEGARSALTVLLAQGESGVGLVIGLASQLLRLGVAVEGGQRGLEAVLPVHQRWLAKRLGAQARKWTMAQIDYGVRGLLDTDRMLKASPHTDEHFIETWLLSQRAYVEAA